MPSQLKQEYQNESEVTDSSLEDPRNQDSSSQEENSGRSSFEESLTTTEDESDHGSQEELPNKVKSKKAKSKPISRSLRAGITFPVGRFQRLLKKGKYAERISSCAPVYLASVLEYLTADILDLASSASQQDSKKSNRITPRNLQLGIQNDSEMSKLLSGVIISQGGVVPQVHPSLLPKNKRAGAKRQKKVDPESDEEQVDPESDEVEVDGQGL